MLHGEETLRSRRVEAQLKVEDSNILSFSLVVTRMDQDEQQQQQLVGCSDGGSEARVRRSGDL